VKRPLTIVSVLISCMLIPIPLIAQTETFVPATDITFTISTERNRYGSREPITVTYQILNVSNAPVYVPQAWEVKCPGKPHVWAWFENRAGKHFVPGYGGSCSPALQTIAQRMSKEAILLKPGEHANGTLRLDPTLFGGLPPGRYRIEAVLTCWNDDEFTAAERKELQNVGSRFVRGEIPASANITLMP
jgi:hypothetical protein